MASAGVPRASEFTAHISQKRGQFRYFDQQLGLPDWSRQTILDFGGNVGNFLDDAGSRIRAERYWCLDIVAEAIEIGRRKHPCAHWIFYDRYNRCYNPRGVPGLRLPALDQAFDCMLAYSVFTHIMPSEMQELIAGLSSYLTTGGRLAFTFIDPRHESWPERPGCSNFQWRLERIKRRGMELAVKDYLTRTRDASWFALVDDGDDAGIYLEDDIIPARALGRPFHVYHSVAFMRRLFPEGRILPPVWGETQHCCVLSF